jgi:hypothetical protein
MLTFVHKVISEQPSICTGCAESISNTSPIWQSFSWKSFFELNISNSRNLHHGTLSFLVETSKLVRALQREEINPCISELH